MRAQIARNGELDFERKVGAVGEIATWVMRGACVGGMFFPPVGPGVTMACRAVNLL